MERIKKIVHIYEAKDYNATLTYMDTVESPVIDFQKLKKESRDLKIDTIIEDSDNSKRIDEIDSEIQSGLEQETSWGAPMTRSPGSSSTSRVMGVKLFSKNITISNKLTDSYKVYTEIVDKMISYGDTHITSLINKPLVIKLSDYRKSVSKIIAGSCFIATSGRRGPAHFILMNREMISALGGVITVDDNNNMNLSDIMVIPYPVKDKTVMGRLTKVSEPGISLATYNDCYSVIDLGFYPEKQYITLDIDYT